MTQRNNKVFLLKTINAQDMLYRSISAAKKAALDAGYLSPYSGAVFITQYRHGATRRDKMVFEGCHIWLANEKKWLYRN